MSTKNWWNSPQCIILTQTACEIPFGNTSTVQSQHIFTCKSPWIRGTSPGCYSRHYWHFLQQTPEICIDTFILHCVFLSTIIEWKVCRWTVIVWIDNDLLTFAKTDTLVFSRPWQSQGLLYKHSWTQHYRHAKLLKIYFYKYTMWHRLNIFMVVLKIVARQLRRGTVVSLAARPPVD